MPAVANIGFARQSGLKGTTAEAGARLIGERFGPSWLSVVGGYEMPYAPRNTVLSVTR